MWTIIGVIVSFLMIFVLVIRKVNIGVSLLLGSVVLGLFSLPLYRLAKAILDASVAVPTLELFAVIVSIAFFNSAYQNTGMSRELTESLGKMIPSRGMLAVIPVIFGILPVSGGALFSAPLVDVEGSNLGLKKERKAFLNVWFRHIPHLLYPLETALVIASYLTGVDLAAMILYQIPVFVAGIAIGYLTGLRGIKKKGQVHVERRYVRSSLVSFLPVLLAVFLAAILGLKVFVAVLAGTVLLFAMVRPNRSGLVSAVKGLSKVAPVAFGIMIFRHVVEVSGALETVAELVQTYSVWPAISLVFLPMLIGFALGESSPSITVSLSILLVTYEFSPPAACLAYTCMYFGHLISPSHLCFSVTIEYFQTGILQIYKRLVPATIATLSVGIPAMILLM